MNNDRVFRSPFLQKGYGLGGYFKRFFNWITPLTQQYIVPKVTAGLKDVGSNVINAAANIAQDALKGRNFKESINEHGENVVDVLQQKAESIIKGAGKRKKKNSKNKKLKNKRTKKDIFN